MMLVHRVEIVIAKVVSLHEACRRVGLHANSELGGLMHSVYLENPQAACLFSALSFGSLHDG